MTYRTARGSAVVILIVIALCSLCHAEDQKAAKVKGLEIVSETANAVVDKADALLTGNLEITMSNKKNQESDKRNYTRDVMGTKVPKNTI